MMFICEAVVGYYSLTDAHHADAALLVAVPHLQLCCSKIIVRAQVLSVGKGTCCTATCGSHKGRQVEIIARQNSPDLPGGIRMRRRIYICLS